jgi:hypothetical protein
LRNGGLHPTMTSKHLHSDLLTWGIDIDSSTVRRRLPEIWRNVRKSIKKQLLTPAMKQRWLACSNKYRSWTTDDWKKVAFSDELHFFAQGYRANVRRSDEQMRAKHPQHTVKCLPTNVLGGFQCKWSWKSSSSWWHDEFIKVLRNP